MSELVEKVARAMIEGEDDDLSPTDKWLARAAIAAVAEWLTTQEHGAGAAVMLTWELKQLEQSK